MSVAVEQVCEEGQEVLGGAHRAACRINQKEPINDTSLLHHATSAKKLAFQRLPAFLTRRLTNLFPILYHFHFEFQTHLLTEFC